MHKLQEYQIPSAPCTELQTFPRRTLGARALKLKKYAWVGVCTDEPERNVRPRYLSYKHLTWGGVRSQFRNWGIFILGDSQDLRLFQGNRQESFTSTSSLQTKATIIFSSRMVARRDASSKTQSRVCHVRSRLVSISRSDDNIIGQQFGPSTYTTTPCSQQVQARGSSHYIIIDKLKTSSH